MGIAAYNRGTEVNRRLDQTNLDYFQAMAKDADRLAVGVKEMAERFHYFKAAGWYRDARVALKRGLAYRRKRSEILAKLRDAGFYCA